MIDEINTWLNSGQDFMTGVAIYAKYGTSPNQKRMFINGGEDRRNRELLLYELKKLIKDAAPIKKVVINTVIPLKSENKPVVSFEPKLEITGSRQLTSEANNLKSDIISKLKERDRLHATLEFIPKEEDRKEAAFQILDLSDEIGKMYDRLNHFEKHGILPPEKKEEKINKERKTDIGSLLIRRGTLRTYISKYERRTNEAKNPEKHASNQEILDKYKLELLEVDEMLKNQS
jgi:hypothetical protein